MKRKISVLRLECKSIRYLLNFTLWATDTRNSGIVIFYDYNTLHLAVFNVK